MRRQAVDSARLLEDARALTGALRRDIRPSAGGVRVDPATPEAEQAAVRWTLVSVLTAFFEDNGLVPERLVTRAAVPDPWDRCGAPDPCGTVADAVDQITRTHPLATGVFPSRSELLEGPRPGKDAADELLSYWARNPSAPVGKRSRVDLASGDLDTAFIGSLYEHLSEASRRANAFLTTPGFVTDLVLDLALEPAMDEAGTIRRDGLRFVDPACGSGGFLLGAFHRILERVRDEAAPAGSAVAIALSCVHGADRSPIAVLVSRFRLAVAAIRELGTGEAEGFDAGNAPLRVVEADSLLEGRGAPVLTRDTYQECREEAPSRWDRELVYADLLGRSSYDVVVSNPPYLTVRDKDLSDAYRAAYRSAQSGAFALTAPFTECAFALARPGGRVGLLMGNSFAKRDFGRPLVEEFLPTVTVTEVVDTSRAYIPGHGVPTLILAGTNRTPLAGSETTVVSGLRGEPAPPEDPERGRVWLSILERLAEIPSRDVWTMSRRSGQQELHTHPWKLSAPEKEAALEAMRSERTLGDQVQRIGYVASTGSDDLFGASPDAMRRWGVEPQATVDLVTGSEVRDWQVRSERRAFFPRQRNRRRIRVDLDALPRHRRRLWPYRLPLAKRSRISPESWYDWHQVTDNTDASPWSLVFPWVATHPHFALNRGAGVPLNSAPVIEFPAAVTEDEVMGLLGVLNSSAVCFWLKQFSNAKGNPRDDQLRSGDTWDLIYEFTSTRLQQLPLPPLDEVALPRELDTLARHLVKLRSALGGPPFSSDRIASLGQEWEAALGRMLVLQEELDWRVYELYGLVPKNDVPPVPHSSLPEAMSVGQRPFEILLARAMARGEEESHWFERHGAAPATELPGHWSEEYRSAVQARLEAITNSPLLRVLERPDFKHRWVTPVWEEVWRPALEGWLLRQCERRQVWYTRGPEGTEVPAVRTVAEIAGLLEGVPGVAEAVDAHTPGATPRQVLPDLLQGEHVPCASALRYRPSGLRKHADWKRLWEAQWRQEHPDDGAGDIQDSRKEAALPVPPRFTAADFLRLSYWSNRGKFDVPGERFISYPGGASAALAPTSVLGWAGWDACERARALVGLIERGLAPPTATAEAMMPLLAGLLEVLPWVSRTGAGIGPVRPCEEAVELRGRAEDYLGRLGLTDEDVMSWRPPAPRRGRPPKNPRGR